MSLLKKEFRSGAVHTIDNVALANLDYIVIGLLLICSAVGGAICGRKSASANVLEYLQGGRSLSTIPVAFSLIATYVSGVTILGTPTEVFNYGTQYTMIVFGILLHGVAVVCVFLPVFCNLRLVSSYEYLELRFNKTVRKFASIVFLIDQLLFLPQLIYIPAMAFTRVSGINMYGIGSAIVVTCIFYTTLGGLRAVVWTDTCQICVMLVGVITVATLGTIDVGGMFVVFHRANEDGRLVFFDFDPSPYRRHTIWSSVVGGFFYWTAYNGVNQTMVQRYMSLPTYRAASMSVALFTLGAIFIVLLCSYTGLVLWAALGVAGGHEGGSADDSLLPAYVVAITRGTAGLPGIFLAAIIGAALSSLSSMLNASGVVVVEDLMSDYGLTPRTEAILARVVAITLGLLSLGLVFVVEKLGSVLSVATALSAVSGGATCGLFLLGLLWFRAGPISALGGAIAGYLVAGLAALGGRFVSAEAPLAPLNPLTPNAYNRLEWFPLFRLSYNWIAATGLLTTFIVGMILSLFENTKVIRLDPELFVPAVRRFLPESCIPHLGSTRRNRGISNGAELQDLIQNNTTNPR